MRAFVVASSESCNGRISLFARSVTESVFDSRAMCCACVWMCVEQLSFVRRVFLTHSVVAQSQRSDFGVSSFVVEQLEILGC